MATALLIVSVILMFSTSVPVVSNWLEPQPTMTFASFLGLTANILDHNSFGVWFYGIATIAFVVVHFVEGPLKKKRRKDAYINRLHNSGAYVLIVRNPVTNGFSIDTASNDKAELERLLEDYQENGYSTFNLEIATKMQLLKELGE